MLHYLTIYVETFITLQLCLRGVAQLVESHCYWPDSTDASTGSDTYVPCFVNASTSVCCLRGDLCLTTGLCFTPDLGQVYRATCTDRLWKNKTACPDLCGSGKSSVISRAPVVVQYRHPPGSAPENIASAFQAIKLTSRHEFQSCQEIVPISLLVAQMHRANGSGGAEIRTKRLHHAQQATMSRSLIGNQPALEDLPGPKRTKQPLLSLVPPSLPTRRRMHLCHARHRQRHRQATIEIKSSASQYLWASVSHYLRSLELAD